MPHYDSDDSTIVGEERHRRRHPRYPSPSEDSYYRQHSSYDHESPEQPRQDKPNSNYGTLGKVALLVGAIALFEIWQNKKSAERDREDRRQKRKAFERAKRKRRREEERREREQELDGAEEPMAEARGDVRRITYKPDRSRSKPRGRIETSPEDEEDKRSDRSNSLDGRGYDTNRSSRSRAKG